MSNENNISKGLLIGFLAGGAVGALLALLYAPKSGKEFRSDIREKADEYMDEAEKYMSEAQGKAKALINEGKKRGEKIIVDAKVKADGLLKDAEKIFTEAKDKAGSYVADGKDTLESEAAKLKNAIKAGVDVYKETKKT
ncbi:MAG: YtxH domain-containing protein [Ignavibacteriaceae bacterium]|nr:YtxH domain-containing protein [Ignavibacteriaceae bacterium]